MGERLLSFCSTKFFLDILLRFSENSAFLIQSLLFPIYFTPRTFLSRLSSTLGLARLELSTLCSIKSCSISSPIRLRLETRLASSQLHSRETSSLQGSNLYHTPSSPSWGFQHAPCGQRGGPEISATCSATKGKGSSQLYWSLVSVFLPLRPSHFPLAGGGVQRILDSQFDSLGLAIWAGRYERPAFCPNRPRVFSLFIERLHWETLHILTLHLPTRYRRLFCFVFFLFSLPLQWLGSVRDWRWMAGCSTFGEAARLAPCPFDGS